MSVKNDDLSSDLKKESCNVSDHDLSLSESPSSLKRWDTSSSTLPLDSEPENFVQIVKIVKPSSPVLAPQNPLSAKVSVPVPEVFGPPLATSSRRNLTEEFNKMKTEDQSGQEYIEDSSDVSDPYSVAERYYSQIGSRPTPPVHNQ